MTTPTTATLVYSVTPTNVTASQMRTVSPQRLKMRSYAAYIARYERSKPASSASKL